MPGLDPNILFDLQQMLHNINPYCRIFKQVTNILSSNSSFDLRIVITDNRPTDPRCYNTPSATEVAVIMVSAEHEPEPLQCDIVLHLREGEFQRISELHRTYEPLHYVLMFPRGEDGWHYNIPTSNIDFSTFLSSSTALDAFIMNEKEIYTIQTVTAMRYYAYQLHFGCPNEPVVLHLFGRLFQQWIVDMYAIVEQMHLTFLRFNQP
ncbi:10251_t:CDS:1 [Cetraspora pellucida]|uniref:10251_t:CDS:1 n=1 Tax=Cetraspora pellucida TaxID=1433469 RepID=A0A9N9NW13_9GLOM|nr:10251_t:CDS:1 [Cetraspora pellucida]